MVKSFEFGKRTEHDLEDKTTEVINTILTRNTYLTESLIFQLQTWKIITEIQFLLFSDDSFHFAKGCQQLIDLFSSDRIFPPIQIIHDMSEEELKNTLPPLDPIIIHERIQYITEGMRLAFISYYKGYAIQPVDSLFHIVSSKRLQIVSDLREKIDDLVTKKANSKRKIESNVTTHTVRTFNSVHNTITKSQHAVFK